MNTNIEKAASLIQYELRCHATPLDIAKSLHKHGLLAPSYTITHAPEELVMSNEMYQQVIQEYRETRISS